jgi:hypothetical protein
MRRQRQGYDAEKARGGEIILHARWERMVFVVGLGGAVVLGLALIIASVVWH